MLRCQRFAGAGSGTRAEKTRERLQSPPTHSGMNHGCAAAFPLSFAPLFLFPECFAAFLAPVLQPRVLGQCGQTCAGG